MTSALQVTDLSVAYRDRWALRHVDLTCPKGEVMGLLGPNGAGKSTLFKAVLGLVAPHTGSARMFDQPYPKVRGRVGYMPQRAEVDWDFPMTVRDAVTMGTYGQLGWFRRVGHAQRRQAEEAMDRVGVTHLADCQISRLSGGEKQRTFMARVLVADPELYLMDEPFAGVDMASEQALRAVIRGLQEQGRTVVVVHHDLTTVPDFCTWATILERGEVVTNGPLESAFTPRVLEQVYGVRAA